MRQRLGDVSVTDKRSPLLRMLQDARTGDTDHIEVSYARQWPTFFKAQRQGYLDTNGDLTAKGKSYLLMKG